jgi:hypothetical protein
MAHQALEHRKCDNNITPPIGSPRRAAEGRPALRRAAIRMRPWTAPQTLSRRIHDGLGGTSLQEVLGIFLRLCGSEPLGGVFQSLPTGWAVPSGRRSGGPSGETPNPRSKIVRNDLI